MHTRKYDCPLAPAAVHSGQILPSLIDGTPADPEKSARKTQKQKKKSSLTAAMTWYIAFQRCTGVATKLTHLCPCDKSGKARMATMLSAKGSSQRRLAAEPFFKWRVMTLNNKRWANQQASRQAMKNNHQSFYLSRSTPPVPGPCWLLLNQTRSGHCLTLMATSVPSSSPRPWQRHPITARRHVRYARPVQQHSYCSKSRVAALHESQMVQVSEAGRCSLLQGGNTAGGATQSTSPQYVARA